MRRGRTFAAPFVVTIACSSGGAKLEVTPPAPAVGLEDQVLDARVPVTDAVIVDAPVDAPRIEDALVYAADGGCYRYPDSDVVACPPGGATLIAPTTRTSYRGNSQIDVRHDLRCVETFFVRRCPQGALCNPPRPRTVDCPYELLPHLHGLTPTRRENSRCWYGDVEVSC